jgi:multidrug transporter EmrE-like cation transporter
MAWVLLLGAGLLEVVWAIALGESASPLRLLSLALVVAGIVGLKLVEG